MSNAQEYVSGTDPQDPSSFLKLESYSLSTEAANTVVMRFEAVSNKTYTVQYKDHPLRVTWTGLTSFEPATRNRVLSVTNQVPAGVSPRIYRLRTPRLP